MQLEIRNYYEVLLMEMLSDEGLMDEFQLPVRYIRHLVDTYFFEDYDELQELKREIQAALEKSRAFLKQNLQKRMQQEEANS